ncbi:tetraspanin-8-like [Odontesthes bonariensis]|uniref:tetraspanin-8-like n=1 Tax=Odontesthes bonariensis TaxID=219752 RepID=UPI003F580966
MGKINGCLKCLFIFFNVLFAVIGCVLMYLAVKATAISIQMSAFGGPGVGWLWVLAIGVLGISIFGIVAACSEKELVLKIFAGFMASGMLIMLIFGIIVVVIRNKVAEGFKGTSKEFVEPFMDNKELRDVLEGLQQSAHCCGVVDAKDWGQTIPSSCECRSSSGPFGSSPCKTKPQGTSGPTQIYAQPCSDTIFSVIDIVFKITMGILFGFAVTALLGLLISILMIYQVKRHDNMGGASIAMKGY